MTTREIFEKTIPRDEEYYYLRAMDDWLKQGELNKKDKRIINRKEVEDIQQWLDMSKIERIIFINRVLYEYWTRTATKYKTFWAYKNFMRENTDRIRLKDKRHKSEQHSNKSSAPHMRINNEITMAYKTLGIKVGADKTQIKGAYRNLAKQHHPDIGGNAQIFMKVQEAYEILLSKEVS